MDYRSINFNQINDLNRTAQDDAAIAQDAMRHLESYLARGRAERSRMVLRTLKSAGRSVRRIFS